MKEEFIIREATLQDIPFIVEAIIHAEKSGTDRLSYTTIFGLTEEETKQKLTEMLEEEVDNCELSVSSYLLAEKDNLVVAGNGAWVEGLDGISSNDLKRNLINYYFPRSSFEKAAKAAAILSDIHIPRTINAIQLEIVYVKPEYRGNNLGETLEAKNIERLSALKDDISMVEGQIFGNNVASLNLHKKFGFEIVLEKQSENPEAGLYIPSNKKVLIRKHI
jgi:GNAT superfamily N-acetyltransferase